MEDPVLTELPRQRPLHRPQFDLSPRTNVSCLYPEILALIFSYLRARDKGRAAQVCVAWRDASYHKSVWRGVEAKLHMYHQNADPVVINSLVRRGIKRVRILSLRQHDGNALKQLLQGLKNIESLNLSGCYMVTEAGLVDAFFHGRVCCQTITKLDLSLCKRVTDESMGAIAKHFKSLEVLELGGCCNITNAGLRLIAWGLKNLKSLNLRSCWHVSDQGIAHIAGMNKVTAEGNPKLERLILQDCQRLTDEAMNYILHGLRNLQVINLSFCINISDSGLKYLSKLPNLKELNLRACDNISDLGIAFLSESCAGISVLDLSFCDKVSDHSLLHISQGLFNLRVLSLSGCLITDDGICRLARTLHELETLNLGQCYLITDRSLFTIAESLKNLRNIDLYGCIRLSTLGLEVVHRLPQLTHINRVLWQLTQR